MKSHQAEDTGQHEAATSGLQAALSGLCPRCGSRTLFAGLARFAPRCRVCALDFSAFNVGDGPAAFLTLIVGGMITALAIWLELAAHPPFWLHIILWIPLTAAAVAYGLRISKAWLLQAEYARRAGEATHGGAAGSRRDES